MPDPAPRLVLASGSPRRRAILGGAGLDFDVMLPRVEEAIRPGEAPEAMAVRLAAAKALEVARRLGPEPERRVLGADTIVVLDEEVLGKPGGPAEAARMLTRLLGRGHRVITGVALVSSADLSPRTCAVTSTVVMGEASPEEVEAYVATGEPLDKAGSYALQGEGRRFVTAVEGSESNVIGLPLAETLALLDGAAPAEARRGLR